MSDTKKSSISVRVEDALKEEAQVLFEELGLSMSSAVILFLKASIRHGGIPFELNVNNHEDIT